MGRRTSGIRPRARADGLAFDLASLGVQVRLLVGGLVQVGLLPAADEAEPDARGVGYDDDDREREDYREHPVHRRVRDYLRGLFYGLGPCVDLAGVVRVYRLGPLLEEADPGVGREDLVPARRQSYDGVPRERD